MVGAGWITRIHLDALDRLGRTDIVAVASAHTVRAEELAAPRGAVAYTDVERMLDEQRPDAVFVAVPPGEAVAILARLVERRIPFLAEKPLAAADAAGPERISAAIAAHKLVVAVGYHLRALDAVAAVRERLSGRTVQLVIARWLGETPGPPWWRRESSGGGQVIEQATHFYDLGRLLLGEAVVVGAASTREEPPVPADADVVDATAAVLRFASGAVGSFANTRRLASARVVIEIAASDLLVAIRRAGDEPGGWAVDFDDGRAIETIPPGRDPYEAQAERFIDAVVAGDPSRVFSTYADALKTDRLTRAVVSATGRGG